MWSSVFPIIHKAMKSIFLSNISVIPLTKISCYFYKIGFYLCLFPRLIKIISWVNKKCYYRSLENIISAIWKSCSRKQDSHSMHLYQNSLLIVHSSDALGCCSEHKYCVHLSPPQNWPVDVFFLGCRVCPMYCRLSSSFCDWKQQKHLQMLSVIPEVTVRPSGEPFFKANSFSKCTFELPAEVMSWQA